MNQSLLTAVNDSKFYAAIIPLLKQISLETYRVYFVSGYNSRGGSVPKSDNEALLALRRLLSAHGVVVSDHNRRDLFRHYAEEIFGYDSVREFYAQAGVGSDTSGINPLPNPIVVKTSPLKESPVIKIETKTYANDVEITKLTDDQVFKLISDAEAEVAKLESLKARPARITAKIAEINEGILKLVAELDSRDAVK